MNKKQHTMRKTGKKAKKKVTTNRTVDKRTPNASVVIKIPYSVC